MAYLIIEKGEKSGLGKKFLLDEKTVILGRKTGDNNPDMAFENEFVSRRHAEISLIDNTYKIRDLDSTNGTSINGKIIEPGNFCSYSPAFEE